MTIKVVAQKAGQVVVAIMFAATVVAASPDDLLGKVDAPAWIDAVPALPTKPQEATSRAYGGDITGQPAALRGFYQPYYDRLEAFADARKQALAAASAPTGGAAGMRQAAEANAATAMAQVNGIPVLARMGGIEALANMTPAQQQAAAQQMVRMLQQNPAAALTAAPVAAVGANPNDVRASMAIRQDLARMTQEYVAVETSFQHKDAAITSATGSHHEIATLHAAKAAKIPIVVLGETGREPDPMLMLALAKEMAARHLDRAAEELTARRALVAEYSRQVKALAATYQTWLNTNRTAILASTSPEDVLRGTNTLLDVAGYEMRFLESARRLAEYSENVTNEVAHHDVKHRQLQAQGGR